MFFIRLAVSRLLVFHLKVRRLTVSCFKVSRLAVTRLAVSRLGGKSPRGWFHSTSHVGNSSQRNPRSIPPHMLGIQAKEIQDSLSLTCWALKPKRSKIHSASHVGHSSQTNPGFVRPLMFISFASKPIFLTGTVCITLVYIKSH